MALQPAWDVAPHPDATNEESPGSFRRQEIQTFSGGMQPPSWVYVESQLSDWVESANTLQARSEDFCDELAALHCGFEQIHPFLDGNGRAGRLILNLVLVRLGYPPVVIYERDRNAYLRALRRADQGQPGQLGEMIARSILENLYRFVVPAVAGPARLVPLAALANDEISVPALRTAATRGRLQATRGPDGGWRSSRNWVDEYLASRHKPDQFTPDGSQQRSGGK